VYASKIFTGGQKMKTFTLHMFLVSIFLYGCGVVEINDPTTQRTTENRRSAPDVDLRKKLFELQSEIQSLISSDYATCGGSLSAAAQNICKIAQAATVEVRVELRGAISSLASQLESRINNSASDFSQISAAWKQVYGSDFPSTTSPGTPTLSDCQNNTGNASILGCISKYSTDIQSIQTTISALSNAVTGAMTTVEIGSENVGAGPLYEQLVRLGDKLRINAYTDGLGTAFTIGSNPINATNASSTVTVTITAHGLSVGERVRIEDCSSGRGFTWQHLNGVFTLATVPTANTFTISLAPGVASSGGTLGGSLCVVKKYSGAGMSTIWTSANPSDASVRTTSGGSKSYNFIIKKGLTGAGSASEGYLCYDTTNRSAVFATLNAATAVGANGNIQCK
jgi:hypothetical protein